MKEYLKKSNLNLKNLKIKILGPQKKILMKSIKKKKNTINNQKRNLYLKKIKTCLMILTNFCEQT